MENVLSNMHKLFVVSPIDKTTEYITLSCKRSDASVIAE